MDSDMDIQILPLHRAYKSVDLAQVANPGTVTLALTFALTRTLTQNQPSP